MTTSYIHQRHIARRPRGRTPAMLLIAVGLVVFAALAFIVGVLWPRWPAPPAGRNAPALPVTVAGVAFNIPPAAVRVPIQRQPGAHDRIDLAFLWPSLRPPTSTRLSNGPTKGMPQPRSFARVFVTIVAARGTLSPAERVKSIYPRYLEAEAAAGPDGLAVATFRQGTPYQGEDLIYDAIAPEKFLVRCSRNGVGRTPGTCLDIRRIGDAEVTVRFLRDWLSEWRSVADKIERLMSMLRPSGG